MHSSRFVMPISKNQAKLNQELRDYFISIVQVKYTLPEEDLKTALAQDFAEYIDPQSSSTDMMEAIGIAHYFRTSSVLDHQLMLCSITDSKEQAQAQLKQYQQPEYKHLRKALNVYSHWIFAVPKDYLWMCQRNEFTDWSVEHSGVGSPEVWIVDELRLMK